MNVHPEIAYLYGLQKAGIKLGLDNARALCAALGDPQDAFPIVHVAGTNGKGSTASFIAAALRAAGLRTGLYTSPHLVDFTERIRVDGAPVPVERVAALTARLRPEIEARRATFFEAVTAVALRCFADAGTEAVVLETGLGGRLDATNVVTPLLSVITTLGLDHAEYLGGTLHEIAFEKAGIIKPGRPCVTAPQPDEAMDTLRRVCAERGSPLTVAAEGTVRALRDFDRMEIDIDGGGFTVGLAGRHQAVNAALAVAALARLRASFPALDTPAARRGLADVRALSGLRGRLERLQPDPEIMADVAHNPQGIGALLDTWTRLRAPERTHLLFGVSRTKDAGAMCALFAAHRWASVTLVGSASPETATDADLAVTAASAGLPSSAGGRVADALHRAQAAAGEGESILLCGSHFVVGEYLADLTSKRK